ncbi:four and a half LIM domains protein 2-like isoform X2 [Syngnathoides biaculeatus]|nr:four and a half LIM domains protein 2-like isoform X2 [Syngnathoides biaculeatus]
MAEPSKCNQCEGSLYGQKFILNAEIPHCVKCYEKLFCNNCFACGQLIGCTSKDVSFKAQHWHGECFLCKMCNQSLVDQPFATRDEMLVCSACHITEFSAKCHACLKNIMPGSKKMEHKGNSWHEACFTCKSCQQLIGTKSFIQKDASNYCLCCYEKNFALQCIHCKKPIITGGVNYHDQPWHKECFVCTGCKQQLAGQRFTSRDDLVYCFDCFCNLFAKRCAYCTTPISGLGGSKYISFQERQWHNDCFNCKRCCVSLVGRGFLTCNDDVFCPDCGKDI